MRAFQDYYPDHLAHCYGCGRLNEHGYHVATVWDGEESLTRFTPREYHTAVAGYVYGGLLASLIDCHSTGTAAAAMYRAEGREMDMDTPPAYRFVTASLLVTFAKPTPLGPELEIRGRVAEIAGRKVRVTSDLIVGGLVTVTGDVLCVQMPENLAGDSAPR
ncbi:MAG TPA: PaaI family thioesterase [Acidimicrobiales bacterium]|nr:PaaI family thioesterase [Acidimicrobiales bacterium]